MAVAGTWRSGSGIVESADHVYVVAVWEKRREAWRNRVILARLGRDPITLRNAVAVEPEEESALDGLLDHLAGGSCSGCIRCAPRVEHRDQRRQSDQNLPPGGGEPFQYSPARKPNALGDYLRHEQSLQRLEILSTVLMTL